MQNSLFTKVKIVYLRNAKELYEGGLSYATPYSVGLDLRACLEEPYTVHPQERTLIATGISLAMPDNMMAGIYSRSGLGAKHGVVVTQGVGVIDPDYRGEIFVALYNISSNAYTISVGERVAQIIFDIIIRPDFIEAKELDDTERGAGGFGHSGKE